MDPKYDQLIEPPRIAFTFGAPGWDVLGALLLVLAIVIVWLGVRHYKKNRYRRKALALLGSASDPYAINMILKRVAMTAFPRDTSVALRGTEWIAFLNASRRKKIFDETDAQVIGDCYLLRHVA